MNAPCAACGCQATHRHHVTGRDGSGRYLDPDLWAPLCHGDHSIQDDDWRSIGVDGTPSVPTFLERLELSLRRLATFFSRLNEAADGDSFLGRLAAWCVLMADGLRRTLDAFDRAMPSWRQLPEVRNG